MAISDFKWIAASENGRIPSGNPWHVFLNNPPTPEKWLSWGPIDPWEIQVHSPLGWGAQWFLAKGLYRVWNCNQASSHNRAPKTSSVPLARAVAFFIALNADLAKPWYLHACYKHATRKSSSMAFFGIQTRLAKCNSNLRFGMTQ